MRAQEARNVDPHRFARILHPYGIHLKQVAFNHFFPHSLEHERIPLKFELRILNEVYDLHKSHSGVKGIQTSTKFNIRDLPMQKTRLRLMQET